MNAVAASSRTAPAPRRALSQQQQPRSRPSRQVHVQATEKPGTVKADVKAVDAAPKKAAAAKKVPKDVRPFTNKQMFVVPAEKLAVFKEAWAEREAIMRAAPGFEGFTMDQDDQEIVITSSWANIPAWEAMNLSKPYRRSHMPYGIYQRIPAVGEGFPEDFVPFLDMNTFVTARY